MGKKRAKPEELPSDHITEELTQEEIDERQELEAEAELAREHALNPPKTKEPKITAVKSKAKLFVEETDEALEPPDQDDVDLSMQTERTCGIANARAFAQSHAQAAKAAGHHTIGNQFDSLVHVLNHIDKITIAKPYWRRS